MRYHIESGHNFMLAKKREKQQQRTILACNPRAERACSKTNNSPHVVMSCEIDIATELVGMEKNKLVLSLIRSKKRFN